MVREMIRRYTQILLGNLDIGANLYEEKDPLIRMIPTKEDILRSQEKPIKSEKALKKNIIGPFITSIT